MPMRRQVSISIAAAIALTACGGGGGYSAPPPPPANAAVDGIWGSQYTNAAGNAAVSLVLATADGGYFSIGIDTITHCQGVGYGALASSVNDLTVTGSLVLVPDTCTFADGTSIATVDGSGTIQAAQSISLTALTLNTSMSSYPADYDWLGQSMSLEPLYNEASSFARVAGMYNVPGPNSTVLGVLTIAADGTFTYGPDTAGCSASGSLSIIDPQHAIMGFTGDFVNCGALGAGMSGDAVLEDTGTPPALFLAIFKNSTAVGVIAASHQ
jgi:hypothetical protein